MKQALFIFLLLISGLSPLRSQEKEIYKIINSNQLIIGSDTLKVGISKLQDHFSKAQIDSLGIPVETQWDGDCDSGSYRSYWIKNKDYKLTYNSDFEEEFHLDGIEIKLKDDVSVSLGDSLQVNCSSQINLLELDTYDVSKTYPKSDSISWYKQEGFWLEVYKNRHDLRILSIHLHSKDLDYNSKKNFHVNGKVFNNEFKSLPGVLLLGYTDSDSLIQVTSTNIDGVYFLRSEYVRTVDVVSLGYEVLKIDSIPEKGKLDDYCLSPRVYNVPEISLFRSGRIEYDTTLYLNQFPVVREDEKINYLDYYGCKYYNFDPIMIEVGYPLEGFKMFYQNLISQVKYKRKSKGKEVCIWFTLTKYGKIELEKITGGGELINEEIARAFATSGDWCRFMMRGRRMDVKMKMKLSFK